MNAPWHQVTVEQAVARLGVALDSGLDSGEAERRLHEHGYNELKEKAGKHPLRLLVEQFLSAMVLILLAAAGLSAALGKTAEAAAILVIVVMFAVLGFVQEFRAERAMATLLKMTVPVVRVRRHSAIIELSARNLVPGDVVLLEAGNIVPADLRLSVSASLRIQESALTGESEAVDKEVLPLEQSDLAVADRRNMAYMGTVVTNGRGTGLVVSTGMQTELGRIEAMIQQVPAAATPLQRQLNRLGRLLALSGAVVAMLILVIGLAIREPFLDMVLTGLSVAVAVVPEGLPSL